MADVESKSIPHKLPSSHWLKATGQCVLERYLSATMIDSPHFCASIVLLVPVLYVYTPESGVPIVWRKLLHEQLRTHKVITKDEVVVVWF